ncbi:MAG: AMP-binding protein [Endozoicomonas sp.]
MAITDFWNFQPDSSNDIALITENDESISYGELDNLVESFKASLPESRNLVFLYASNSLKTVVAYTACLRSSCPVLLLAPGLANDIQDRLLSTYNPNLLIHEGVVTHRHEKCLELHQGLAVMLSTSGSTGSPKLVRLSKKNLSANAGSIASYLGLGRSEVAVTSLPFNYSYGLSVINSHLHVSATLVLIGQSIISREFWAAVKKHSVTSFAGVPYTYQMLRKLKLERFPTGTLRYLTQAGGKLDAESVRYFHKTCKSLGKAFYVMYGQTEATARIAFVPSERLEEKAGSIGVAIPGGHLSLVGRDGDEITSPNCEGELVYSGDNVMLGYASKLADLALGDEQHGRLSTGDVGYFDDEGFFYITGRLKRFLKIFGLRLSLDQIDDTLAIAGFEAIAGGEDDLLKLAVVGDREDGIKARQLIADKYKINVNRIDVVSVEKIARKHSGKIDYKRLFEYEQ